VGQEGGRNKRKEMKGKRVKEERKETKEERKERKMASFLVQFVARPLRILNICFCFTWEVILVAVYHEFISVTLDNFCL
jgi:hypothetical protein